MTISAPSQAEAGLRVLLLVTTRRDAEITQRLLGEVGLAGHPCRSLEDLRREIISGVGALLATEEAIGPFDIDALAEILHPADDGRDIPTVLLTPGGSHSTMATALMVRLQNLTILERPAPIQSILSATQSAVRVRLRQREMAAQLARIADLQNQLTTALTASELGTFHREVPTGPGFWSEQCKLHFFLPRDAAPDLDLFSARLHPEDRTRVLDAAEACISRREKYDMEFRVVSSAGEIRWLRASGQTRPDGSGQHLVFSGTTQDITARKKLEEERGHLLESERTARRESERANRLKDEFLATLSHELRTPLNAVMCWVEVLKQETTNPDMVVEGLQVIERNVRAQTQLVDDLLDVSRIISGKVRLDIKPLNVGEVLAAALETVQPTAGAKGVRLESFISTPTPQISGDFSRLQQVVWNLLTNAVKFTPRGGKVQLILEQKGSALDVSVTDTGEGIEAEFLPHVFERFRQADGTASRRHGGLGLGLSIVKTLIEMHGGRVSVQSDGRGRGATFRLQLPVRLTRAALTDEPARSAPALAFASAGDRPDLSEVRILVVDDEPDGRNVMRRLLESCRAISREASSAEEATRLISEFKPQLILSDIGMPGTDGYQFIRDVRRSGISVPAVALTAFARSEDRVRSIQAGFQAHLTKPIEAAELLTLVGSLAGRLPHAS